MRIADVIAVLDPRPTAVVAGGEAADELTARVAQRLGLPSNREGDAAAVVLVVVDEDVAAALAQLQDLGEDDHCLLLLEATGPDLPTDAVAAAAGEHGLELVEVRDLAHPVLRTALRLVAADDVELAAVRTELLLEREGARRARAAVDAAERELARRGERIDALRAEVTELRERVETLEIQHERELATNERALTTLQGEVGQLEASASYRIGHALVRLVKEPRLLARVPARLLRWLRS